jgi:hypothetical protein
MGYDTEATIRYDGRTARGTVLLETKEVLFRGAFRLAIPLADLTGVTVEGDRLVLAFAGRSAEFELGAAVAAKWANKILHPPSRLDKLGVKPEMLVALVTIKDTAFVDELERRGAVISRAKSGADLVFFGASRKEELDRLEELSLRIKPNGAVWVIRPKGQRVITESDVMAAGKRAGLVDVKVVSFSETHTAEKFVVPLARRPVRASPPARHRVR